MNNSSTLPRSPPPPDGAALVVERVDTLPALTQLWPTWEALWCCAPTATPFQSPAWLLPWWRHVGQGRLATLALREPRAGALVGLAPLYVYPHPQTGRRHLFPLGIATTDDLEPLVAPGWERAAAHAWAEALAGSEPEWDLLELPQLRPDSVWLQAPWPRGWQVQRVPDEPHPVLALTGEAHDRLPVPRNMRQNLRSSRARAARAGPLQWHRATGDTLRFWLDALARLHGLRWQARGEAGVLHDGSVQSWHGEAAPLLEGAGLLRLWGLTLEDEPIAALYALMDPPHVRERRCHYYLGGFEPAQAALSPGTLAVGHAVEQARAEGAAALDFLRGAERYKYHWGARDAGRWLLRVTRHA